MRGFKELWILFYVLVILFLGFFIPVIYIGTLWFWDYHTTIGIMFALFYGLFNMYIIYSSFFTRVDPSLLDSDGKVLKVGIGISLLGLLLALFGINNSLSPWGIGLLVVSYCIVFDVRKNIMKDEKART